MTKHDDLRKRQRADEPRSYAETPEITEAHALAELRRYRELYPDSPPEVAAFGLLRLADQWIHVEAIQKAVDTLLKEG